jgi:hypothetical protein
MAGYLPTVFGGHSVIAPVSRDISTGTQFETFENMREQRWADRAPLDTFTLQYKSLNRADRDTITAFFNSQKGSYDKTWNFNYTGIAPALPSNGNFALGLKDWISYNDQFGAFAVSAHRVFTRTGETDAVFANFAVTMAANADYSGFLQSASIPATAGMQFQLNYWTGFTKLSSVPTGVNLYLDAVLFGRAANGALTETVFASRQISQFVWTQVNTPTLTVTNPATTQIQVAFVAHLQNVATSSRTVPFNGVFYGVSDVQLYRVPQTGVYPACAFEDDAITWTMNADKLNRYDTTLRFRQTRSGGQVGTQTLTNFPLFNANFITGYPYVETTESYVARVDLSTGNRNAYAFTGLPNFPGRALKKWKLTLSTLTDGELGKLEVHFLTAQGSRRTFGFTEPTTNVTYSSVRYASDTLAITHLQKNLSSATLQLQEVYRPGFQ